MLKSAVYPPLDSLFDLACRDGVDIRPTLLRVLTDLYVQKPRHSAEEEAQYVELALGLIEAVDFSTRAAVAASLSAYPIAPAVLVNRLASDSSVAAGAPTQASGHAGDLVELFFAATAEERRLILTNFDVVPEASSRRPAPASSEVIRRLEAAALQHNVGEFSRMLERALSISRELAERIARDTSGEPIVVAAKALGMKAAVLQRILLYLNPAIGQSVGRVYDLADFFEELTPHAAERMVAIWQNGTVQSRPVHQPALYDDERRSARSQASPARHRSAGHGRDEQLSRFKTGA